MKCVKVTKTEYNPHTTHTQEERIRIGPESFQCALTHNGMKQQKPTISQLLQEN